MKKHRSESLNFFLPVLLFMILCGAAMASEDGTARDQDTLDFQILESKKGEICIVCGMELGDEGVTILYKGRRVPLYDGQQLNIFYSNPEKYFSKLQPKGALFQEKAVIPGGIKLGWFIFGIWVTVALLSGALTTGIALRKGLPPAKWFFIGLAASLPGLVYALAQSSPGKVELPPKLGKIPNTSTPIVCPSCGALNHPCAKSCTSCNKDLTPEAEAEVKRAMNV